MKRRYLAQFAEEKTKLEQEQQEILQRIKDAYESKISLSKQRREVKNDKLFEAESQVDQLTADIEKIKRDADKNIDRRVQ